MAPDVGLSTQILQSRIINVIKGLKETLFKELKESIMTVFKYKISVKREVLKMNGNSRVEKYI